MKGSFNESKRADRFPPLLGCFIAVILGVIIWVILGVSLSHMM